MRVDIKDVILVMPFVIAAFLLIVAFLDQLQPDGPVVPSWFHQKQVTDQHIPCDETFGDMK